MNTMTMITFTKKQCVCHKPLKVTAQHSCVNMFEIIFRVYRGGMDRLILIISPLRAYLHSLRSLFSSSFFEVYRLRLNLHRWEWV